MPTDRLLVSLLRSLQSHSDQQDTPRLLSTATTLLATLGNPLNLTLVCAQLLAAPAIWTHPDGLRLSLRFMAVFQSAAVHIIRAEDERHEQKEKGMPIEPPPGQPVIGGNLSREEWVRAVLRGADERTPRWRHMLVIAGLLVGFEGQDRQGMSPALRGSVERAFTRATNAALDEAGVADELAAHSITLALNYAFEYLSDAQRVHLKFDRLLPVLIGSTFFSAEGYRSGYFLAPIEADVHQVTDTRFAWPEKSKSYAEIHDAVTKPLVASMGPLSRLISHTVENVSGSWLVQTALEDVAGFADTLHKQWRQTRLSEVDLSEESLFFDQQSLDRTLPTLWRYLRTAMFAVVIILRGIVGRVLNERHLSSSNVAPGIATTTLHCLRNMFFATSRLGGASFSQYTFVHLAAIDILSAHPPEAHAFVAATRPGPALPPLPSTANSAPIPADPHERTLTLFFFNTVEHLTLALSPEANEEMVLASAAPYLFITRTHPALGELFEAAHAATLAVLSSPESASIAARQVPFYLGALFDVFPKGISARQFRLAARTLARIVSPPGALAASHPRLAETLLEILREQAIAPEAQKGEVKRERPDEPSTTPGAALTLALIDCLPAIAPDLVIEWLATAASTCGQLAGPAERAACRSRLWECISGGEMDAERAALCVAWWGTGGGRAIFEGDADASAVGGPTMSGGASAPESKL